MHRLAVIAIAALAISACASHHKRIAGLFLTVIDPEGASLHHWLDAGALTTVFALR